MHIDERELRLYNTLSPNTDNYGRTIVYMIINFCQTKLPNVFVYMMYNILCGLDAVSNCLIYGACLFDGSRVIDHLTRSETQREAVIVVFFFCERSVGRTRVKILTFAKKHKS